MFPLQAVSARLTELVIESDDRIAEESGWRGVSSKYYSVEQEHYQETVSLLDWLGLCTRSSRPDTSGRHHAKLARHGWGATIDARKAE
jgi:hypothetical protein